MQQEEVSLQSYLDIIWRRKLVIIAVFTIVWSLSLIGIMINETVYKASSLVAVKNQMYWRQPMMSFSQGTDDADTVLSGEAYQDIINGIPFAEKVATFMIGEGMPLAGSEVHSAIHATYQEPDRIRIDASSTKPEMALTLANTAAHVFEQFTKENMVEKLANGRESALVLQGKARRELDDSEAQIAQFRHVMGFMDIGEHMGTLRHKIAGFESQRGDVITRLEIAQAHRKDLLKLATAAAAQDLSLDDPHLEDYRNLQLALGEARIRYTEDHPKIRNLTSQIESIETRLRQAISRSGSDLSPQAFLTLKEDLAKTDAEIADLQTAIESWSRQIAEVQESMAGYPEKQAQIQSLEARAASALETYRHWSKNLEELEFKKSMVPGNANVVDTAVVAGPSISKTTSLMLATLVSLMLAIGMGLLAEFGDSTLRNAEEIASTLGLGYLGSISRLKEPRSLVFQDGKPVHQVAESYIRVYSNIKFAEIESPFRSVLLTSARKGEGKSTTLVNLACAIAAAGKRVIVVDTDLRNPSIQRILGSRHMAGVTSVLAGEHTLEEALKPSGHPGLTLLPSGPIPPNPAELLHSKPMKELIRKLETMADLVIFDTPPALLVADAMLLSGEVDAAIIVAESGGVSRKAVAQVKESLQVAKMRILGVILNKTQEGPSSYYNYYSYYQTAQDAEEAEPATGAVSRIRSVFKSVSGRT
ncbi:MAG: polysaccharide biosynthesis tyrosine autokinase [Candidatus Polarisedimenticolia bacterium]